MRAEANAKTEQHGTEAGYASSHHTNAEHFHDRFISGKSWQ